MAETIEDISYNYEDEGRLVRKELDKSVLTKGAWATIMFLYQDLDRQADAWRAPKVAIVRYKKSGGGYRKQSSFNISNEKQARSIIEVIETWYGENGSAQKAELVEPKPARAKAKAKKGGSTDDTNSDDGGDVETEE